LLTAGDARCTDFPLIKHARVVGALLVRAKPWILGSRLSRLFEEVGILLAAPQSPASAFPTVAQGRKMSAMA